MRRRQQEQLLELMGTLREATAEIARQLQRGDAAAARLLADCQDSALRIGAFIERTEGEGTRAVELLARYCELLFRLHGAWGSASAAGLPPMLCGTLQEIENSIKTDIVPNRLEVAFLPYKAAMWDSMESVWLAARADPRCDAYVVPIPYFDRSPTGEPTVLHWEGDQYPETVPITDYRKYNVEERHPDVVVIHSPYDSGNHVTTVHPDFYSQRLKAHTDLLVYIPYFVAEDIPEHFCTCTGVLHAHRIIVQSEKARDTYMRAFRAYERANRCPGRFGDAQTKFLALGSPKFDRVYCTRREDVTLPADWRRLIFRSDGTRRKVLFYNTTLDGLLHGDGKELRKLRTVFAVVRSREDAVLLWRPHPLSEATYGAMRPQLFEDYRAVVEEYRAGGWGIYDDTADLHRALALADGYFGDGGSAMHLFASTGRPIMVQSADVASEHRIIRNLARECFLDEGGFRWFPAYQFNGLLRTHQGSGQTEFVGSFVDEPNTAWRMYRSVAAAEGKLYFAPYSADGIAVYDTRSGQFASIPLKAPEGMPPLRYNPKAKFNLALCCGRTVTFFPATYPAVVRYDLDTGTITYDTRCVEHLEELAADNAGEYFRSACVRGAEVYLSCGAANAVTAYNMETGDWQIYEVGPREYRYGGMCFDGQDFWLAPRAGGPVVRWNPTGLCRTYDGYPQGYQAGADAFCGMVVAGGFVWMLPNTANMALKMDVQTGVLSKADVFQGECEQAESAEDFRPDNYILCAEASGVIVSHTGKTNRCMEYDAETGELRGEALPIPPQTECALAASMAWGFAKDFADLKKAGDCFFLENIFCGLEEFLDRLVKPETAEAAALKERQEQLMRQANEHMDGTSGQAIYDTFVRETLGSPGEGKR